MPIKSFRHVGFIVVLAFAGMTAGAIGAGDEESVQSYKPQDGYVPDAVTAIKIAVAVWEPIYGAAAIAEEKPYHAVLRDGVWVVEGSLPEGFAGGVAIAEIAKDDGRILRVDHGK